MGFWAVNSTDAVRLMQGWIASQGFRRLVVVDGGAAGGISEPFDLLGDVITAVRFEPRGKETLHSTDGQIVIDGALWSQDSRQTLRIARNGATSSLFRPNNSVLARYDDAYGTAPRTTVSTRQVTCRSIDSCVATGEMPVPDAIKLDVHGSELPALLGSEKSAAGVSMLLIETWNTPIHLGQGLHYEVEAWAYDHGFHLFDYHIASAWRHKHGGSICSSDRPQVIGSEVLFFRVESNLPPSVVASQAFFLGIFGYLNAALDVIQQAPVDKRFNLGPLQQALVSVQNQRTRRYRGLHGNVARRVGRFVRRLSQ